MSPQHTGGFTVLEMLVVLIILAMATTLGFQALGQLQSTMRAMQDAAQRDSDRQLLANWWSESVRGALPTEGVFHGDPKAFSMDSLAPVFQSAGAATQLRWTLEQQGTGWQLLLDEAGRRQAFTLPGTTEARFVYVDPTGATSPTWPPNGSGPKPDELPAMVLLARDAPDTGPLVWAAAVIGPLNPPFNPDKLDNVNDF